MVDVFCVPLSYKRGNMRVIASLLAVVFISGCAGEISTGSSRVTLLSSG